MSRKAAQTGSGPTVTVAIEQFFPEAQRIIHDDLAHQLVPSGMKAFIRLMKFNATRDWMVRASENAAPGIWSGLMCRKRYIDEKLLDSVGQLKAVVNLGVRFYRKRRLAAGWLSPTSSKNSSTVRP
jgi:O-methyltransferase involved in polyketide biosynthesis